MSVSFFNSLRNDEHSGLFIVTTFSNSFFSNKMSSPDSYLPTFPDDKAEIVAFVYLNYTELCFAQFCYRLFLFSY